MIHPNTHNDYTFFRLQIHNSFIAYYSYFQIPLFQKMNRHKANIRTVIFRNDIGNRIQVSDVPHEIHHLLLGAITSLMGQ